MALRGFAFFAAATTVGVWLLACQAETVTSREHGVMRAESALIHAQATGSNHHWDIDVALREAPEGSYVLLFSQTEPASARVGIAANDPVLRCATGRARGVTAQPGCVIADAGEVLAVTRVGVGGAGSLRAAFDGRSGGFFTIVRVGGGAAPNAATIPFDVQIVSEALTRGDEAHRFTIEQRR